MNDLSIIREQNVAILRKLDRQPKAEPARPAARDSGLRRVGRFAAVRYLRKGHESPRKWLLMRTIQNNPRTYVSRSEMNRLPSPLPDRSEAPSRGPGTRDFVSAEIERNFP